LGRGFDTVTGTRRLGAEVLILSQGAGR